MSGGHFDYQQYRIGYIIDKINDVIRNNGRKKTKEELKEEGWRDPEWYEKYPEDLHYYKYPDEVIKQFTTAVGLLQLAQIYAHRIDWLLSGDDGEETFLERLEEDLQNLEQNK